MKLKNIGLIILFVLAMSCGNSIKTLGLKIKLMSGYLECDIPYNEIIKNTLDTALSDYSANYIDYYYHYTLKLNTDTIHVDIETTVTKDERFFVDTDDAKKLKGMLRNLEDVYYYSYTGSYNSFKVIRNASNRYYLMNYNNGIYAVYISKKGIFRIIVSNVKDNQVREDIIQSIKINHTE